ncbi:MAG: hypothetical protein SF339_16420 [Blastocatellia bacterium]|nr:hypothetical protein [Blastocatellia bacterium]
MKTIRRISSRAVRVAACALLALSSWTIDSNATMKTTIQIVEYKGWKNNLQLSNGTVDLLVTLDVGPRVIRYGYVGGANVFKEFAEQIGKSGEKEWMIRGGHRLWHAPEDAKRTYDLDNGPVRWEKLGETGVRVIQPVEPLTGIQKEMEITLGEGTAVTIVHRLRNTNLWDVELAPWALSVMAPGGVEIIPLPEKISHPGSLAPGEKPDYRGFIPNQTMIVWPFTDLADPRWRWGTRYITLRQDVNAKSPTKLGLAHQLGWIAYLNGGVLFVKQVPYEAGKAYTDGGSNFETFTNRDFLEIESLGPLARIAPAGAVEHVERWGLASGVKGAAGDDASIDAEIRPHIERAIR